MKCLLVQVHIPHSVDVQGNLTPKQKKDLVSLSCEYYRKYNPNDYLVLSGHGEELDKSILDLFDFFYWETKCRPLDGNGYMINDPAHASFIGKATHYAKNAGCKTIAKVRGDGIVMIPNFSTYCDDILKTENKKILLTQQTYWREKKAGDCVLYTDCNTLYSIFNDTNPVYFGGEGLANTGLNLFKSLAGQRDWSSFLKQNISFRDIPTLKWVDFRWHYHKMCEQVGWADLRDQVLSNTLEPFPWLWGQQYHKWDRNGNLVFRYNEDIFTEKEFY